MGSEVSVYWRLKYTGIPGMIPDLIFVMNSEQCHRYCRYDPVFSLTLALSPMASSFCRRASDFFKLLAWISQLHFSGEKKRNCNV